MSDRWPPGTVKIHENCGGLVRWVEAVQTPGVGYHGDCLECDAEELVIEDILPLLTPGPNVHDVDVVNETDRETLADLKWADDLDWEANQARFREEVAVLA